jgi:hypothetical protein
VNQTLEQQIFDLEKQLLMPEIRQSVERFMDFFSKDFIEFGSSGRILYFSEDYFKGEQYPPGFKYEIKDFKIKILAQDVVLATYKGIKHHESMEDRKYSLRSSIWKCFDGKWKMIFHQGTPTKAV